MYSCSASASRRDFSLTVYGFETRDYPHLVQRIHCGRDFSLTVYGFETCIRNLPDPELNPFSVATFLLPFTVLKLSEQRPIYDDFVCHGRDFSLTVYGFETKYPLQGELRQGRSRSRLFSYRLRF